MKLVKDVKLQGFLVRFGEMGGVGWSGPGSGRREGNLKYGIHGQHGRENGDSGRDGSEISGARG